MTHQAYLYYRSGHQIYSNYKLTFPFIQGAKQPIYLTMRRLKELVENKKALQNVVLLIDEAHIFIDSRSSMEKKRKIITYFILQTRKSNVRLLYTTQHMGQVDKRLRDTTDIICMCSNLSNKSSLVKDKGRPVHILQQSVFQWRDEMKPRKKVLYANPIFSLFDTTEMIDMETVEE